MSYIKLGTLAGFAFILVGIYCYVTRPQSKSTEILGAKGNSYERVSCAELPNCIRLTNRVFSGGLPEGKKGFRKLSDLGVKTIISVDGAQPEVRLAEEYGICYVHLPHGYDGVSDQRQKDLAVAIKNLKGPFYIHCHHGKHRSPAAAAVACIGLGEMTNQQGLKFLELAGTSPQYKGLFQSVAEAKRLNSEQLVKPGVRFPANAKTSKTVDAMVGIEECFHLLSRGAEAEWKSLKDHPDTAFDHEALMLKEHFTELLRAQSNRQPGYAQLLSESESYSKDLQALLNTDEIPNGQKSSKARDLLEKIKKNCQACHKQFRD